uniref:E3 ubiquitin-protein ligase TRAIP-like n=1 Tax=Sinocyclocheilus anshuiensis TaxID=1608454 RepID=A0A671SAG6_9TELE
MPIRAYCTICSDFFDNSKDVAAIHCGHTFHYVCLLQWFQSAPNKTCPQCRKQVSTRHIINKLFFDIAPEDDGTPVDPESLQNELDRMKAVLSEKEKEWRDKQKSVDTLKDTIERQKRDLDRLQKEIGDKEMLCAVLRKQMNFLESQKNEGQAAKEEAKRLRVKMKTYESLDVVLQGQRSEVEAMITDMGVGQSAVEQLSIYCISLKKEYDNLKGSLKSSNEMCEKLKRELISSNSKLQKATAETNGTKEDMKALQNDLSNADKEITVRNSTLLHFIYLHLLIFKVCLNASFLFQVRSGYDGLGGRAKFIQPSPLSEIRPLAMKSKRKKVSRPVTSKPTSSLTTLDGFLE